MLDERLLGSARKMIFAGIIFCILGLMFIPLLPWVGITGKVPDQDGDEKEVTVYLNEMSIRIAGEAGESIDSFSYYGGGGGGGYTRTCWECDSEEFYHVGSIGIDCYECDEDDWWACNDCGYMECDNCGYEYDYSDYYYYSRSNADSATAEDNINIGAYTSSDYNNDMTDATEKLSDNIGYVTLFFWLALLFLILGFIGVAFANINNRNSEITGKIFLMIGAFALIFAILSVVFYGLCFMNVNDMQTASDDLASEFDVKNTTKYSLGYNYLPLIFGILLLVVTAIYMAKIFPKIMRSFRRYPPPGYGAPQDYGPADYGGGAPPPRGPPGPGYDAPPPQGPPPGLGYDSPPPRGPPQQQNYGPSQQQSYGPPLQQNYGPPPRYDNRPPPY